MSFFYLFLSSIRECLFDVNIYTSLPLRLTANLINRFLHLFLSSIRECLFGVNIYTSLPLALTANLINRFLHLFLFIPTNRINLLISNYCKADTSFCFFSCYFDRICSAFINFNIKLIGCGNSVTFINRFFPVFLNFY